MSAHTPGLDCCNESVNGGRHFYECGCTLYLSGLQLVQCATHASAFALLKAMARRKDQPKPFWQFEVPGNTKCTCGAAWDPECPTCGCAAKGEKA
jgi:hypothetical protein